MMKNTVSLIAGILIVVVSGFGFASGAQEAASDESVTINMSYNGPPDVEKNAVHLFASEFKRLVEEKTDGAVEITLYPNSQLGDEEQRMEQAMNGPMFNVASYGGVGPVFPELFAAGIPFMFDDFTAARYFFDESEFWREAQAEFRSRTGVELIAAVEEGGFLAFTNSVRPIKSPADFDGLKFRAMDESQVALYQAFGASGTPIPWTEVYMALQTNVADGQMNPPMYIIIGSLYEVQEYMTNANIQYSMQYLVANGEMVDNMSDSVRQAVMEAAEEANAITRADVESRVSERTDFIASEGVEVYDPTPAEMDQFRELGQPSYMEWLAEQVDQKWIDLALESARMGNQQ